MPPDTKNASRRQTVRSVEVSAILLKALGKLGRNATLSVIAGHVGMPAGKTHRYLKALLATGFVKHDATTGSYKLGGEALQMGLTALGSLDIGSVATRYMADLSSQVNQTCNLGIWGNKGATVVQVREPNRRITVVTRIGSVLPLLTSATGLVFTVFLPTEETASKIAAEIAELQASGMLSKDYHTVLEERLRAVRRNGMAAVNSLYFPGIAAIAAPVFGPMRRLEAVITVLGPTTNFDLAVNGRIAQCLLATAAAIGERIGYPPASQSPPRR